MASTLAETSVYNTSSSFFTFDVTYQVEFSIWEMGNSSSVADQLGKPKARGCCPRLTRRRFSRSGNTIMEYRRCAIKATYLSSYTHALKHNLFSWSDLCFLPSNPTIATQYQGGACIGVSQNKLLHLEV